MADTVFDTRYAARGMRYLEVAATALIAVFLAGGLHRIFITNINWDEFYYLSFVHLYRNGDLSLPLQTLHVHVFAWLPWAAENEVHQVFAARIVVWLAGLIAAWLMFRIARRFCGRLGALFAVALYLSFSYVVEHGLSFRADPLCAALFLLAADLLINSPKRPYSLAVAAIAMATAMLVSLKAAFYLPSVAVLAAAPHLNGLAWISMLRRWAVFGTWFLIAFAVLFVWHKFSLAPAPTSEAGTYAAAAGSKVVAFDLSAPGWPYVVRALAENPLTWMLIAYGFWNLAQQVAKPDRRTDALLGLSFALPLLSILVYRNTFPYYFVFVMPAAVILAAIAIDRLAHRAATPGGGLASAVLAVTLALGAIGYGVRHVRSLPDQTVAQAEVVRTVHTMFPTPVPYIDRNSMIASFHKVGFFMSSWGVESYRAANRPIMSALIARHQPPLLIANTAMLDLRKLAQTDMNKTMKNKLLNADIDALSANFIHHWGPLYVAGKQLAVPPGGASRSFEIVIAGTYTLESQWAVLIDDVTYPPGSAIHLGRGAHRLAAPDGRASQVTLRWGRALFRPDHPPSPQPIYIGF